MGLILKLLAGQMAGQVIGNMIGPHVNRALEPASVYLRKVSVGFSFLAGSIIAWITSLFFLMLSLFFYLGQLNNYIAPALWTGVISLGIGLILIFYGLNMMRHQPR